MPPSPLQIVHVTLEHAADDARIHHKELRALIEAYGEVWLVAPPPVGPLHPKVRWIEAPRYICATRPFAQWKASDRAIAAHIPAPRLIHAHEPQTVLAAWLYGWCDRQHLIYDAHEFIPEMVSHGTRGVRRCALNAIFRAVDRTAARVARAVITVNQELEARYRGIAREVTLVTNAAADISKSVRVSIARDPAAIVYAGGLSEARGALTMIESSRALQQRGVPHSLHLAGPILSDRVREAIDEATRDGASSVQYHGVVPHEKVMELLLRASVALVPFHRVEYYRGVPVKLLEYAVAGNSMIVSDHGPKAVFVREHQCGEAVPPGDAAALADAVQRRLERPDEAREEGRRASEAVGANTWDAVDRPRLLGLYRRIIEEAR